MYFYVYNFLMIMTSYFLMIMTHVYSVFSMFNYYLKWSQKNRQNGIQVPNGKIQTKE